MNATDLPDQPPVPGVIRPDPPRSFNIVVLYDSPTAARESRRVTDHVVKRCLADIDVHRDEFSFAELAHPELREETLELSANCDFLVMAVTDGSGLSADMLMWLGKWLATRAEKETALLCLTGRTEGDLEERAVSTWMRLLAARHEMPFFTGTFLVLPEPEHPLGHPSARPEAWGINE